MRGTLIVSLIIAVIAVIFALANPQFMMVDLIFAEVRGSTALILIVTLVIGTVVGILATLPSRLKSRKKRKAAEKELKREKELQQHPAGARTYDQSRPVEPPAPPSPSDADKSSKRKGDDQ